MEYFNRTNKAHNAQLPEMTSLFVLDEHESSTYNVGDIISGHLIISPSKSFFTHAIRVVLEGSSTVTLDDKNKGNKSETFLKSGVDIVSSKTGETMMSLPEGEQRFPFTIMLHPLPNAELHGTMKTNHGFVQYQLVAYSRQSDGGSYKMTKKILQKPITGYFDLSAQESSLMTPIIYEKMEKFTSFPASKTRLLACLKLQRSGYLQGEVIPFVLEIINPNDHDISTVGVTLVQKFTYFGTNQQKIQLFEMRSVESKRIQGLRRVWEDVIPIISDQERALVPSQSGIIEISHFLKVRISSSDGPFLLEAALKIGTTK